jgi:hypothetical protein
VFYSGHVKAAINIKIALIVGVILGSWEAGRLGTKSKFCGHYHLIDKANQTKKMKTCFRLSYNVTQNIYIQNILSRETCFEIS